jgi:hypothetical protein
VRFCIGCCQFSPDVWPEVSSKRDTAGTCRSGPSHCGSLPNPPSHRSLGAMPRPVCPVHRRDRGVGPLTVAQRPREARVYLPSGLRRDRSFPTRRQPGAGRASACCGRAAEGPLERDRRGAGRNEEPKLSTFRVASPESAHPGELCSALMSNEVRPSAGRSLVRSANGSGSGKKPGRARSIGETRTPRVRMARCSGRQTYVWCPPLV